MEIKETDNLLIIIDYDKRKTKFFLKGNISSKKIVKNVFLSENTVKKLNILNYFRIF